MLHVGSLFSGIGGFDLAFEWAGCWIAYQVEVNDFCRRVLAKHWRDVPRWEDVRHVGKHNLPAVDIICGGVPCQPASLAGKRRGTADPNWLWGEAVRIIDECRPAGFVWENVPGLRTLDGGRAFADIVRSFTQIGYCVEWTHLAAADVGAPHERNRLWIVGYAHSLGHTKSAGDQSGADTQRHGAACGQERAAVLSQVVTDYPKQAIGGGDPPGLGGATDGLSIRLDFPSRMNEAPQSWEAPRTAPRRADHADRMRALGNAIVPQQAYPIVKALVDYLERANHV